VHFAAAVKGALLIAQGARDPNVTPANVAAMRAALDAAGIAYDTLVVDDVANHQNPTDPPSPSPPRSAPGYSEWGRSPEYSFPWK
jgi:hypothetical protein